MAVESSRRRIAAPDAKNRGVLLDAAERLMVDEGYAAVTSRRVAEKAGLKHQLVHYYFRGMDDLFGALFVRRAEEGLRRQTELLETDQPLWALWRFGTDPTDTRLTMEFAALANHRKALRAQIAHYAERFRDEQRKAVACAFERYGIARDEVPPVVFAVLATSVSRVLVMEHALGMSTGHAETIDFVEGYLHRLEGEPQPVVAGAQRGIG